MRLGYAWCRQIGPQQLVQQAKVDRGEGRMRTRGSAQRADESAARDEAALALLDMAVAGTPRRQGSDAAGAGSAAGPSWSGHESGGTLHVTPGSGHGASPDPDSDSEACMEWASSSDGSSADDRDRRSDGEQGEADERCHRHKPEGLGWCWDPGEPYESHEGPGMSWKLPD